MVWLGVINGRTGYTITILIVNPDKDNSRTIIGSDNTVDQTIRGFADNLFRVNLGITTTNGSFTVRSDNNVLELS